MGIVWSILAGLALLGVFLYFKKKNKPGKKETKVAKVKYVKSTPLLTAEEEMFYFFLNSHSANHLILDHTATVESRKFSKYANTVPVKTHVGIDARIVALRLIGATSVSEVYVGGYREKDTNMRKLMESPSHAEVIKGDYTHVGVGVVGNHYTALYFKIK